MIFLRLQFPKNNVKKLFILLLALIIASCVDPEDLDFSLGGFCQESSEVEFRDGLYYFKTQKKPYSGDNICIYKGNGGYAIQGEIRNGLKYGIENWWYKSGQKMLEVKFKDGKEEGIATAWYEDGQKRLEVNLKDGKENGKSTEWNEDGAISLEAFYKDGECISGDC